MGLNYYIVDVFTDTPFSGAQIAVFPEAKDIDQKARQRIANELNLWESVFIIGGENSRKYSIKVQTPDKESVIGAHTSVAAAYVIAKMGNLSSTDVGPLLFENNNEEQTVYISRENEKIKQPLLTKTVKPTIDRFTPSKESLSEILSIPLDQLDDKDFSSLAVACDTPYLIVPVKSLQAVLDATFKYKAWSISDAPATFAQEILLFTKETEQKTTDFHLKLIGPDIGRLEDPPVGAAIPAFAGYLCDHKHIKHGTHIFSVERGLKESRQSILHIEMDNKGESSLTIRIGGSAVITGEGKIYPQIGT